MILRLRLLLLAVALLCARCSNPQSEDLDNFCKIVNEVNRDSSLPTAESKLTKIAEKSPEFTKGGAEVWKKIADAPNEKKYALLRESANQIGKSEYKCSGYEKLLATMTVEELNKKKALEQQKTEEKAAPEPQKPPEDDKKTAQAASKKKHGHTKKKKKH